MNIISKFLFFILFYKSLHGFNIKNNLQTILSTKAITSAFANRINTEVFNENLIISDIIHHNTHIDVDILYFALITGSLIYKLNYNEKIVKLNDFEIFTKNQKRTNLCLFILAIVFTRNIENAI